MKTIFLTALLVFAMALLGCGGTDENPDASATPGGSGLSAELTETGENGRTFQYILTNNSDSDVTLTFSSGQEYNYILWRNETMVYSYEQVRSFIQAFHERTLKPDESLVYDIALEEYPPDTYVLEAYMTLYEPDQESPAEYRQTLTFTIAD